MTPMLSKLTNGLTVVTDPMPHLETAAVGVWVNVGARYEREEENGLSHMLEHMAFKGTATRSAREIAEAIERVGGYLNAYTGRETTAYYARVLKADVALALTIIADILQNSVFDEAELERERGVIIQEIGESEDTPDDVVFEKLQEVAFRGQPMGRSILGTAERVARYPRHVLQAYMAKHYGPGAMTVIASGAVTHEQILRLAETLFGAMPAHTAHAADAGLYSGGEHRSEDDLEQAHLALAWPGLKLSDEDLFASQIYSTALGGGMSSRLFQEAREKRGLCYSIYAYSSSFKDCGLFGVYAGTSGAQASELVSVVAAQMKDLAAGARADEVDRARAQAKAGLLMSMESPAARCEQIAGQLHAYGRLMDPHEIVTRIDAVDANAVRKVGERILRKTTPANTLSLSAVGQIAALDEFEKIARQFG